MKIDEKMIEQMTEEEQQELLNLIQKQQEKKKQKVAENLVNELREVIKKMEDENLVFDYIIDTGSMEYHSLDTELDDGNVVVLHSMNKKGGLKND